MGRQSGQRPAVNGDISGQALAAAVRALLTKCGLPVRIVTVLDTGRWRCGQLTGTWADDGEVFLDD